MFSDNTYKIIGYVVVLFFLICVMCKSIQFQSGIIIEGLEGKDKTKDNKKMIDNKDDKSKESNKEINDTINDAITQYKDLIIGETDLDLDDIESRINSNKIQNMEKYLLNITTLTNCKKIINNEE